MIITSAYADPLSLDFIARLTNQLFCTYLSQKWTTHILPSLYHFPSCPQTGLSVKEDCRATHQTTRVWHGASQPSFLSVCSTSNFGSIRYFNHTGEVLHLQVDLANFAQMTHSPPSTLLSALGSQSITFAITGSYESLTPLTAWARTESSVNFAKVASFVRDQGPCDIKFNRRSIQSPSRRILFLRLGSTRNGTGTKTGFFAWLEPAGVEIGHMNPGFDGGWKVTVQSYIDLEETFVKLLRWVGAGEESVYPARLDVFLASDAMFEKAEAEEIFMDTYRGIAHNIGYEEHEGSVPDVNRSGNYLSKRINGACGLVNNTADTTLPGAPSRKMAFNDSQAATTSSADLKDILQPIYQAFATFRAGIVERLNTAKQNSHRRSAVLEYQVEELETEIEDVKAERQQLNNGLVEAKSEADKCKA